MSRLGGQEPFRPSDRHELPDASVRSRDDGREGALQGGGSRATEDPAQGLVRLGLRNRGEVEARVQEADRLRGLRIPDDELEEPRADPALHAPDEGPVQEHREQEVHHVEDREAAPLRQERGEGEQSGRRAGLDEDDVGLAAGEGEEVERVLREGEPRLHTDRGVLEDLPDERAEVPRIPQPKCEILGRVVRGIREPRQEPSGCGRKHVRVERTIQILSEGPAKHVLHGNTNRPWACLSFRAAHTGSDRGRGRRGTKAGHLEIVDIPIPGTEGAGSRPAWGERVRRIGSIAAAQALVALLLLVSMPGDALLDDFEQDFWLPFTHFNLGDLASAGYVGGLARSGERSYRVAIQGWAARDFGSAYGYAIYATSGASLSRLRVSILHASLADTAASPWDGFLAGVGLQLLDAEYRTLGTYRYVTAYRASLNAGRCGPTLPDVVLEQAPPLGAWDDLGRDPAADFPSAPWSAASFVKVSIGFLCAAGLTGADYRLHFDDFALDTDLGDRDGDGIDDLEEETRRFVTEIAWTAGPLAIPDAGASNVTLDGPRVSGHGREAFLHVELAHPHPEELSVALMTDENGLLRSHVLWDPGFHARTLAVLSPVAGAFLRGEVLVSGRMPPNLPTTLVFLRVDGVLVGPGVPVLDGTFQSLWNTDAAGEGPHLLRVESLDFPEASQDIPVIVDRTPPELRIENPVEGAILRGLALVEAQGFDAQALEAVELWIDSVRADVRQDEPFVFAYDTTDLTNDMHTITVRARDRTGNEASRSVQVEVSNDAPAVLAPCLPTCNLASGTDSGNLPPPSAPGPSKAMRLPSGNRVSSSEVLTRPWIPSVAASSSGVALTLDLLRPATLPETQGVVTPGLGPEELAAITSWRIVVTDHRSGNAGSIVAVTVGIATRLSASSDDTDGDGLQDGEERASSATSPVLADGDADGLTDAFELESRAIEFIVDGLAEARHVLTSVADGDTDRDGLSDGEELMSFEVGITDPADPDTDRDTLTDGEERTVYGSDPTLRNTDGDGFLDGYEIRPRPFSTQVNGVPRRWELTTSPILADTDDDRIQDDHEELGLNGGGIATHPALPDTDEDGLNDSEELLIGVDGFETHPLNVDSDGDRVWDTFDKLPHDVAAVEWTADYPAGLIRFDQDFRVFWIEGLHATTTKRFPNLETGEVLCVELGDDVAASTKTSVVTAEKIVTTINEMFAQASETRYDAVRATRITDAFSGFSTYSETIGSCPEHENEYYIEYRIHEDTHRTSFKNVATVTVEDESERSFEYGFVSLPVDLGRSFSVILQFSIDPAADRSYFTTYDSWLAPAFTYAVFGGPDFTASPIIHSGTAFGTELNEFAYRVELRVPGSVLTRATVTPVENVPMVGLYFSPGWVGRVSGIPARDALDPATLRVASISTERPELVYSLIVRLDREDQDLLVAQAESVASLPSGFHTVGAASVYVFRETAVTEMDPSALETADAILLVSSAESDLFAVRDSIDWGGPGVWYRSVQDPWGNAVKAFRDSLRITRVGVVVAQFAELLRYRYAPPGTYVVQADPGRLVLVEKGEIHDAAIYVISTADSQQEFLLELTATGDVVVRKHLSYRITASEITTDLTTSRILTSRYATVKAALRGLGVGAVLATNGREAVIGFQDGDIVKGIVYSSNAAIGVLGILRGEMSLATLAGLTSSKFRAIRLGSIATVASGALLAGFEAHLGFEASDPISRQAHFERAAASAIDTGISLVPIYGSAVLLAWGFTSASISILMPSSLAARITSTPGSSAVFLFEYFLTGAIPAAIAENVLSNVLGAMLLLLELNVAVFGIPSVPLFQ